MGISQQRGGRVIQKLASAAMQDGNVIHVSVPCKAESDDDGSFLAARPGPFRIGLVLLQPGGEATSPRRAHRGRTWSSGRCR